MTAAAPNQTLRPLKDRKTPAAMARRAERIVARETVARTLLSQMGRVVAVVNNQGAVLQRGFLGRLKWLVLGR